MILGVTGRGGGAGLGARSLSLSTTRIRCCTSGERDRSGTKRTLSTGPRLASLTTRRKRTSSSILLGPGLTLLVRSTMVERELTRTGLGDLWRGRSTVSISLCLRTNWPGSARLRSSRIKAGRRSLRARGSSSYSRTGARRGTSLRYSRSSKSTLLLDDMAAAWWCRLRLSCRLWAAGDQAGQVGRGRREGGVACQTGRVTEGLAD
jgi:hypothetical protein